MSSPKPWSHAWPASASLGRISPPGDTGPGWVRHRAAAVAQPHPAVASAKVTRTPRPGTCLSLRPICGTMSRAEAKMATRASSSRNELATASAISSLSDSLAKTIWLGIGTERMTSASRYKIGRRRRLVTALRRLEPFSCPVICLFAWKLLSGFFKQTCQSASCPAEARPASCPCRCHAQGGPPAAGSTGYPQDMIS